VSSRCLPLRSTPWSAAPSSREKPTWPVVVDVENPLTPREIEVLALAADGLSARDLAQVLVLSTSTVKTHLANIYEKLGVRNRTAAVAKALRLGIID
jgi:ATP/maltotriose-dependent transcriptional regulator MalT